jgi:type I restriction enzyme S subunit
MNNKSSILAFRQTTLGEIARKDGHGIVDGPFGSNLRASEYVSYGIPVIRGSNLSLGLERFHTKDYVFVSKETANRLNRSLCQPDDIIFTKKGTLGQTGIVPRTEPYKIFLLSSNQMKLSVDIKIANPLFVYYYVSSPASRERIIREAMTTGVPKINLEYLRRFPISLPPLSTQKKIAAILSAYDDLIENNTRRIKILEEMAQTLYHEWFVKFRFPGHEQTKMVDSELGLIPEGWEVVSFADIADILSGGTPKTKIPEYWNGDIPFFTPKDTPESFYVTQTEKSITTLGLSKCNSKLYPKNTVFITARGTVGKAVMTAGDMAMNQSCFALKGKYTINQYFVFLTIKNYVEYL